MSRPELKHACDALETRLPGLREDALDEEEFWQAFDRASERVAGLGVDREDQAYISGRVASMLDKHGLPRP